MLDKTKGNRFAVIMFALSIVCLFLPWFTMNRTEVTAVRGYHLYPIFIVTYFFIALYLFVPAKKKWMGIAAGAAGVIQIAAAICYPLIKWESALWQRVIQPEFYISMVIYALLVMSLFLSICRASASK